MVAPYGAQYPQHRLLKFKHFRPNLRLITDAPWYVRNDTLHTDLNMTDVATTMDITYTELPTTIRNQARCSSKHTTTQNCKTTQKTTWNQQTN